MRGYLVALREEKRESQQDVAGALGLSRQYYQMIEAGTRQKRMDITLVTKLADHFEVPISTIIQQEDNIT